jgi:hypothetical protein
MTEIIKKNWAEITNEDNEDSLDKFAKSFYGKLFEDNPGNNFT